MGTAASGQRRVEQTKATRGDATAAALDQRRYGPDRAEHSRCPQQQTRALKRRHPGATCWHAASRGQRDMNVWPANVCWPTAPVRSAGMTWSDPWGQAKEAPSQADQRARDRGRPPLSGPLSRSARKAGAAQPVIRSNATWALPLRKAPSPSGSRNTSRPKGLRRKLGDLEFDTGTSRTLVPIGKARSRIAVQIPVHRGQSFRRIADSVPVIADSF